MTTMKWQFVMPLVVILFTAAPADAQTVAGDRFRFNTGPCVIRSGAGSPEGVVTGKVCDKWHRTDAPYLVYIKRSGAGNTGWLLLASTDLTDTANLAYLNAATNAFTSAMTIGTTLVTAGNPTFGNDSTNVLVNLDAGLTSNSTIGFRQNNTTRMSLQYRNSDGSLVIGSTAIGDILRLEASSGNVSQTGGGALSTTGNATVGGTFGVTGISTLTGLANANGGIAVDTSNFTVSGTTGAIATTAVAALTTAAESWVGPSTTTGVYFKSGNMGFGLVAPTELLHLDHATRPGLRFHLAGAFPGYMGVDNNFYYSTAPSGDFIIAAGGNIRLGSSASTGEKVFIDNTSGSVGIGDTTPDAKLEVVAGDIGISTQGNGLILKATDGATCYRVTVNNAGVLATASVTCP